MIKTEEFLEVCRVVKNLEDEKKNITADVKERIETAAENFSTDKKVLTTAIKEYHKYEKDANKYVMEDSEVCNILKEVIKF